jgi:hypothetical protein
MASRRNPKFSRAQAKAQARSAAAAKGWRTRRSKQAEKAYVPLPDGRAIRVVAARAQSDAAPKPFTAASIDATRKSLSAEFRRQKLAATRRGLEGLRADFLQRADSHSARRMTRLIAEFDFLSGRLPPGREVKSFGR